MRLIDADALEQSLTEKGDDYKVSMFATADDCNIARLVAFECAEEVKNATAIDAVPVVRCKDCKSFKEYTPEFKASNECVEGADGDCITRLLYSDAHPQFSAVRNSDYCSLGVKNNLEGE